MESFESFESFKRDWLASARAAGFLPFELAEPPPHDQWLGGFGGGTSGSFHLDISHRVGDVEVTVETSVGVVEEPDVTFDRLAVVGAVETLFGGTVEFPLTLRFEERTLDVTVDGVLVAFRGIVLAGADEWTLSARPEHDTRITIHGRGEVRPVAIRRRTDLAIPGLAAS